MRPGFGLLARFLLLLIPACGFPLLGWWQAETWHAALRERAGDDLERAAQLVAGRVIAEGVLDGLSLDAVIEPTRDLYAAPLAAAPTLDGLPGGGDGWLNQPGTLFGETELLDVYYPYEPHSLGFTLRLGVHRDSLFLHYTVTDNQVVYRELSGRATSRNDFVQLDVRQPGSNSVRYRVATRQPGPATAWVVSELGRSLREEPRIKSVWRATSDGYDLEVSLPLAFVEAGFATSIADVDDPEAREIAFTMGSARDTPPGTLTLPIPAVDAWLSDLPFTYLQLADSQGRVLGTAGTVAPGLVANAPIEVDGRTVATLVVHSDDPSLTALWREATLTARLGQGVLLAVLAVLIVLIAGGLAARLRGLARALSGATDASGRQTARLAAPVVRRDEVDDVVAAAAAAADRTRQYLHHLEATSGRLSHELRTPVAVVRSSLDSLDATNLGESNRTAIERARIGITRLTALLDKLSEARRLEEALDPDDIEMFDLAAVVRGCVAGYESAWPDQAFELLIDTGGTAMIVSGLPDGIAQMLDKLVANAVEFATADTAIRVRLTAELEHAVIRVLNEGPNLQVAEGHDLFDSMMSMRDGRGDEDHLGLGLYIARIITGFHHGDISLANREDTSGAVATVRLPLGRLSTDLLGSSS